MFTLLYFYKHINVTVYPSYSKKNPQLSNGEEYFLFF